MTRSQPAPSSPRPRRLLRVLVPVLALLAAGLLIGKNLLAKAAIVGGVRAITGLRLSLRGLDVGLLTTRLHVKELQVLNPAEFPQERVMLDIPEIYVHYDLPGFLKGRAHLEEVRLHLRELTVVRNEQGRVNLNALQAVKQTRAGTEQAAPAAKTARAPDLQIDVLELRIGRVVYKDYSGRTPQEKVFPIDLNERFTNISNPAALGGLIVTRALAKTTVARLANFDVKALEQGVAKLLASEMASITDAVADVASGQVLQSAGKTAEQAVKDTGEVAGEAVKETTKVLKNLLGN